MKILALIIAFCLGALLGIHRRVIKALIKGEPMPQAPASHFWLKNRKEDEQ